MLIPGLLKQLLLTCRPKQWVKNILLFVPLVLAHKLTEISLVIDAVLGLISFTLVASSIYIVNDIFDKQVDQEHPVKKFRPIASGKLLVRDAVIFSIILLVVAGLVSFQLPIEFQFALLVYLLSTNIYTFKIKSLALLDVITLACLYTLRIISGAVAINVPISYWLVSFSVFFFLSLALVKRVIELGNLKHMNKTKALGRAYVVTDIDNIRSFGITSGYLSILVFALYINDDLIVNTYQSPAWLWGICLLLLYWISRIWFIAHSVIKSEDPVLFAVQDKTSYLVLVLCLISFSLAV